MLCLVDANDAFTKHVIGLLGWPTHKDGAVLLVDIPAEWVESILGGGWSEADYPPGQPTFHAALNPQGGLSLGITTEIKA